MANAGLLETHFVLDLMLIAAPWGSTLSHAFPPLGASLFTDVFSSSYFFGNLGASNFGIVPAIRNEDSADLAVLQKVVLQSWHYNIAKARIPHARPCCH